MQLGTNFWWISWGNADPFRDGHENVSGDNPWDSRWIDEIRDAPYTTLRMMDWNQTNSAQRRHPGLTWAERVKKTDAIQAPVAYEWQIDFCNRTGKDLWICVPHFAAEDEEYLTNLAKLVHEQLDSKRRVYVEWSNEVWHAGAFDQGKHAIRRGKELGYSDNDHKAGQMYLVLASINAWKAFDRAFGDDSDRITRVLSGQPGGGQLRIHLEALADQRINPTGESFDAFAIAPYFGHKTTTWEELAAAVDAAIAKVERVHGMLPEGIQLYCYEGGQHVWDDEISYERNTDPRMYDLYRRYLAGIAPHVTLFMHYLHCGSGGPRSGNQWGAKLRMDQPLAEAHKLRALLDWARESSGPYRKK
jgi:hypothetical protein